MGEALALMRHHDVGSVLLTDANGAPVGMFTPKDSRDRVARGDCDVTRPIANVMTARPHAPPDSEPAFEAALTMARHASHHVVVTRAGQAVGVIAEKDLFAPQQVGGARIASALRAADDLAQLRALADDIRRLAHNLTAQGVGAEQLARLVSQLNDQLTRRILSGHCRPDLAPRLRWLQVAGGLRRTVRASEYRHSGRGRDGALTPPATAGLSRHSPRPVHPRPWWHRWRAGSQPAR